MNFVRYRSHPGQPATAVTYVNIAAVEGLFTRDASLTLNKNIAHIAHSVGISS